MIAKEFPDFSQWSSSYGYEVEKEYMLLREEYGDAMPFLSQFKEQRYREAKQAFEAERSRSEEQNV